MFFHSALLSYDKVSGNQNWQVIVNASSVVSTSPFYDSDSDSVSLSDTITS